MASGAERRARWAFAGVAFFAALVLLIETVLFHLLEYIHDFFVATSAISYVVLGVGLGAFAARYVRFPTAKLFFVASVGTTLSLYLTAWVLVRDARPSAIAATTAVTVFFPVTYVTVLFRAHPGGRVYLADMAGAGLGVVATVFLYRTLSSESIVALLLAIVPLVGWAGYVLASRPTIRRMLGASAIAGPLLLLGATLLAQQLSSDSYNIFRIFNRKAPGARRILKHIPPEDLRASYDSLVGRIDILKSPTEERYLTCWNGRINDFFSSKRARSYEYYRKKKIRWPTGDARVLYGLVDEPRIFVIGAAARGITKTAKRITPLDRTVATEIQPGIIEAMTRDFVEESGDAYGGLRVIQGNAVSVLKELAQEFDIITLINTHSGAHIGVRSGPDYLHTAEQYDRYFDHLSDSGYILFEERPSNRGGELGLYRMINTAWNVLKRRGAADPSKHFFIWEYMVGPERPVIDKTYWPKSRTFVHGTRLYTSMIVTREPLSGAMREKALAWYHEAAHVSRLAYLKDYLEIREWSDIFDMIERGDFSTLSPEGFDSSIVTSDRPFPSLSRAEVPEIDRLVRSSGTVCLVLGAVFLVCMFWGTPVRQAAHLSAYNILIGLGYFLIEIVLILTYQNIFVSASWSVLLILGSLLISSGLGGLWCARWRSWQVTVVLLPMTTAAIHAPDFLLAAGWPSWLYKSVGVALIGATGCLMGVYFPRGLVLASRWSLPHKIPYLFALNSVAGAFAVVLALATGASLGYRATVSTAILLYCAAGLLASRTDEQAPAS